MPNFNKLFFYYCVCEYECMCTCARVGMYGPKNTFQESVLAFYLLKQSFLFLSCCRHQACWPFSFLTNLPSLHVYVEGCITHEHSCIWLFYVCSKNGTQVSRLWSLEHLPVEPSHWPYFLSFIPPGKREDTWSLSHLHLCCEINVLFSGIQLRLQQ